MLAAPGKAPHEAEVPVVDDTGDRKAGTCTARVGRQYLDSVGKTDNGIVTVTSLRADEDVYYPLHVHPYTPARRLAKGQQDPDFHAKPEIAVALVDAARTAGVVFRAVVADCFYGDNPTFEDAPASAGIPFAPGLKPSNGAWAPVEAAPP